MSERSRIDYQRNGLYFHQDIPQYVRDAITEHLTGITFSDAYIVTGLKIVPTSDRGYSHFTDEYWDVDIEMEILAVIGVMHQPGHYPTRVQVRFQVPVKEQPHE